MCGKLKYILAVALCTSATAHELTPTYPELKPSYVDNVLVTKMKLWNRRNDVEYYELSVLDENMNPLPFASTDKIVQVGYLEHKSIDVYIRESDKDKAEFICTTSKQLKEDVKSTGIKSMICSRIK